MPKHEDQDRAFQNALRTWNQEDPLPPCPACGRSTMEHWDLWLVTGTSCKADDCGWTMSEGSGCLADGY